MTWTIYGVPIDCMGAAAPDSPPFGTESAPAALRRAGVLDALGARDGGDLDVRLIGATRDVETGLIGGRSVVTATRAVRTLVADAVAQGVRPLLVGGCCTLVPGGDGRRA